MKDRGRSYVLTATNCYDIICWGDRTGNRPCLPFGFMKDRTKSVDLDEEGNGIKWDVIFP